MVFNSNEIWVKGVQELLTEKGICTQNIGWTNLRSRKFSYFSFSNRITRDVVHLGHLHLCRNEKFVQKFDL